MAAAHNACVRVETLPTVSATIKASSTLNVEATGTPSTLTKRICPTKNDDVWKKLNAPIKVPVDRIYANAEAKEKAKKKKEKLRNKGSKAKGKGKPKKSKSKSKLRPKPKTSSDEVEDDLVDLANIDDPLDLYDDNDEGDVDSDDDHDDDDDESSSSKEKRSAESIDHIVVRSSYDDKYNQDQGQGQGLTEGQYDQPLSGLGQNKEQYKDSYGQDPFLEYKDEKKNSTKSDKGDKKSSKKKDAKKGKDEDEEEDKDKKAATSTSSSTTSAASPTSTSGAGQTKMVGLSLLTAGVLAVCAFNS